MWRRFGGQITGYNWLFSQKDDLGEFKTEVEFDYDLGGLRIRDPRYATIHPL
jgi:hypothetical protein